MQPSREVIYPPTAETGRSEAPWDTPEERPTAVEDPGPTTATDRPTEVGRRPAGPAQATVAAWPGGQPPPQME